MAVEGRTYRPVVDSDKCGACAFCLQACPAEVFTETRFEGQGLRGRTDDRPGTRPKIDLSGAYGPPPCQAACPVGQDVRGYMRLLFKGLHREALALIRQANPLPSVCGYVCHHPCESGCVRGAMDHPLAIRSLKKFAAEYDDGSPPPCPTQSRRNRKVAVIGSGPAGLTAAYDLARTGYMVEVFESYKAPGGMLAWAIPEFRLPRHALARDIAHIERMGVRIATGISFGLDMRIQDLRDIGAHAVIIAAGTRKSLKMNLPHEADLEGYLDSLTFLRRYNEHDLPKIGTRILVVGGGNAAIDTARSALRQGGKVTLIYRRSREEMPAERDEVNEALGEGVEFMFRTAPFDILVEGGRVKGLECVNTVAAEPDGSGRRRLAVVPGSQFRILADTILSAVGQEPERDLICEGMCLEDRNLEIDSETMRTCEDDVFVAGDFLNGPTTVIEAMASGRKAALAVDAYLSNGSRCPGQV